MNNMFKHHSTTLQMPTILKSCGLEPTLSALEDWDTLTKFMILSYQLDPDRTIEMDNDSSITDTKLRDKIEKNLLTCKNTFIWNIGK